MILGNTKKPLWLSTLKKRRREMTEFKKRNIEDLYRYTGGNDIKFFDKKRLYGWQYTKIWRAANFYQGRNMVMYLWYGYKLLKASKQYGFQISPSASIGKGLYIGHFGTVIVSNEAIIGNNVNLSPNVVIGRTNRGELKGVPQIGNKCWIGTGAVLVGKIKIGDNVMISPNEFVNYDVPDNSIVICGKIHHREDATQGYIENIVE